MSTATTTVVFIPRMPDGNDPGGLTVSKNVTLPDGEFQLDSYRWLTTSGAAVRLWFVASDNFTADERQLAVKHVLRKPELLRWASE